MTQLGATPQKVEARRAPPRLPGAMPLIGHATAFLRDPIALLARAHAELGPVAEFRLGPQRAVLLSGPAAQETFFRAPDEQVSQRDAYQLMIPIFGTGVVYDATPDRMLEQFHFLIPAFQEHRMRTYAALIAAEAEAAIGGWTDEGVLDVYAFTRTLVGHTSTRCLLGPEFRTQLTDEFESTYADLEAGVKPIAYLAPNLPIPAFRRRDRARRRLDKLIERVVAGRQAAQGDHFEDFLQTLMEARYKDGSAPTAHEVTGLLLAALFAGRDTSSATAAWALLELARRADVQAELRNEIIASPLQPVDPEFGRAMPATDAAIKEVLRLHPPLFMLLRRVLQPLEVGEYRIDPGCLIVVSPRIAHRNPNVFSSPDEFQPDRFAAGREEDKRPYAYIPFGGGRHRCLGSAFAMLQLKAILAIILREFEIEAVDPAPAEDYGILVVGPKPPARIRYRRRRPVN